MSSSSTPQTPDKDKRPQHFFATPQHQNNGAAQVEHSLLVQSPVPLSREEAENAEVRALAAKLAPALVQADELLHSSQADDEQQQNGKSQDEDDEDGIHQEVQDLQASEALLRQELELAQNFSEFFKFSEFPDEQEEQLQEESPTNEEPVVVLATSTSPREADISEHDREAPEAGLPPIRIPSQTTPASQSTTSTTSPAGMCWTSPTGLTYGHDEHMSSLHLTQEVQGAWYSVSLMPSLSAHYHIARKYNDMAKEYCLAVPETKLKRLTVGLQENQGMQLPVRTVTLRIRPDVLCGAVLEAVHHALTELGANIDKRQGGHCQAVVPGAVVAQVGEDGGSSRIYYPPFDVDAQLVTLKEEFCERRLVLRVYHHSNDNNKTAVADADEQALSTTAADRTLAEPVPAAPGLRLRECAALIQRMESKQQPHKIRLASPSIRNVHSLQEAVSEHLLGHYKACPSVLEGGITLPSLNSEDFGVIQSSWRLVQAVWDELESRELAYTTLRESRFGTFPALPTLDVHYCSQIRRLSRETMVVQLLKSASELEEYARASEWACANLISLLKPTFEAYGIPEPALPKPVPLTAYPLEFIAPQASCPPWGLKVQHALNEIQSWTAQGERATVVEEEDSQKSFELAKRAVCCVLEAFQKQDDEEQSARLGRKNVQVMDRLAKMQAHQRTSIERLDRAAEQSDKARKAADDFKSKTGFREVPLMKWSIVVGGSTGTCSITANHVMFVTQFIPVIGGNTVTVFSIKDVDFQVVEATPSLLNPLPTIMSVEKAGQEVYSFRPSMGGARLKLFWDLVKKTNDEGPLNVF